MEKGKFGIRKTTDKPVSEMGMYELALNNCYIVDRNAMYRDYSGEYDARAYIRKISKSTGFTINVETPEKFDAVLYAMLNSIPGSRTWFMSRLYEMMWSKAELYERLKKYENADEQETTEHGVTLPHWIPVTERLPKLDEKVFVACRTSNGYRYCYANYIPKRTLSRDSGYFWDGEADGEYSEEHVNYYIREGWYERLYNYQDYDCILIADFVTHWTPLPEPPEVE